MGHGAARSMMMFLACVLLSGTGFGSIGDTAWWKTKGPTITNINQDKVRQWWNGEYDNATYSSNYDTNAGGNWTQVAEWWMDHLDATVTFEWHTAGWNPYNYIGWHEVVWDGTEWGLGTQSGTVLKAGSSYGDKDSANIPVSEFVFFLGDTSGSRHANWYTMDSLNSDTYTWDPGGANESAPYRHAWTFADPNPVVSGEQGWVFAFEDVAYPSGGGYTSDNDHDDLIVRMSLSSGGGGTGPPPVPELPPSALALALPIIGFGIRRFRRK